MDQSLKNKLKQFMKLTSFINFKEYNQKNYDKNVSLNNYNKKKMKLYAN